MIRRLVLGVFCLGALAIACNATPDIPNDLRANDGTYPGRGAAKKGPNPDDEEAAPEGDQEQVLTGGRAPSPSNEPDAGTTPTPDPDPATDAGTTPTPTPTPTPTGACTSTANQDACYGCCAQKNPGTAAKWNQFWDDCACAANRCGSACAQTWCAGFQPNLGDACDTCLNNVSSACTNQADAVCGNDATCAPLVQCDQASGCATKPL